MKSKTYQIVLVLLMLLACFANSFAQNVTKDANGNYIAIKSVDTTKAIPTGKTYTDTKGIVYPVYKSRTGKLYVIKTSKTSGNKYNYYLKEL